MYLELLKELCEEATEASKFAGGKEQIVEYRFEKSGDYMAGVLDIKNVIIHKSNFSEGQTEEDMARDLIGLIFKLGILWMKQDIERRYPKTDEL